jgi:hypothetical protein
MASALVSTLDLIEMCFAASLSANHHGGSEDIYILELGSWEDIIAIPVIFLNPRFISSPLLGRVECVERPLHYLLGCKRNTFSTLREKPPYQSDSTELIG